MARSVPFGSRENFELAKQEKLRCNKCAQILPFDKFYKDKNALTGYKPVCKPCAAARDKYYQDLNKQRHKSGLVVVPNNLSCSTCKVLKPIANFYRDCSEKRGFDLQCKECLKKQPGRKTNHLKWMKHKRRFGFSKQDYFKMLADQNGCCAICKRQPKDDKELYLDHNHKTNKVRGLLCNNCNTAIGLLSDSITIIKNAAEYLESRGSYGET